MNTDDLRKAARAVFIAVEKDVAQDLSDKLKWAADEIDQHKKNLCHCLPGPHVVSKDFCTVCGKDVR